MEKVIEYQGTPEEWRKLNSKFVPVYSSAKKRKRIPYQKRYNLTYGKETILFNRTFEECVAKRESLKNYNADNYKLQTFKIEPNVKN